MTTGLQQRSASRLERGVPVAPHGDRHADGAKWAAALALGAALLLALWLMANWLAGGDHVVTVSAATVDGGTIGRVLAFLIWATMAAALVSGVVATRRSGSGGHASSDAAMDVDLPAVGAVSVSTATGRPDRRRSRWTAVGLVGAGALFVVGAYHGLLRPGAITWGDWGYFINVGAVRNDFPVPSLWSFATLGNNNILGASVAPIESAMGVMARLGVPYGMLERLWFYFPAVALSYSGPLVLVRRLGASWVLAAGAGAFYSVNPYALALISGGQLTVGVGYALYPWVALAALRLWSTKTAGAGLVLGGLVGVQAWYDPRVAGLSIAGMLIALVVLAAGGARLAARRAPWAGMVTASALFVLLQGTWLVPALLAVRAQLPSGYTSTAALATFSLLSLADGLTLFHPFWPDMHFIALHSVPALWLIVPMAVALSLIRNPCDRRVHVGGALYLAFAALVSGSNPPFGVVNAWLFARVPGMNLFRDPSPYFGPIALGLVVVAAAARPPFWRRSPVDRSPLDATAAASSSSTTTSSAWQRLLRDRAGHAAAGRLALVLAGSALVVVSAWPGLSGVLRHDLAPRPVPPRYLRLDRAIMGEPPGAVLWVPSTSRFAPVSPEHPSVSAFGLESTSGVGFPPVVQGLEWLVVPSLFRIVVQKYDIHTVVVRDRQTVYRNLSLPPQPTRTEALSSVRSLPGVYETSLPGLTVFHLGAMPTYPVAVFHEPLGVIGSTKQTAPTQSGATLARRRQELTATSFTDGLTGWGSIGDGNNYLHQTLSEAGIGASVRKRGSLRWLHLTVRFGAAAIGQSLSTCPSPGLQSLRVRYRTSSSTSVTALVFSAAQSPPLSAVSLPGTEGRWVTARAPFVLAPTLDVASARKPLTRCLFELSVQPAAPGVASSADVSFLSMRPSTTVVSASAAITARPAARWDRPSRSSTTQMTPTGDRLTLTLPAGHHARLIVFWQRFDPGWVAQAPDQAFLRHVEVDGWANGYIVPAADHSLSLSIQYTPQRLSADGFAMTVAGVAVLLLGLLAWGVRLLRR